ncbi:hypothetical protein [Streptomyces sp. CC210A]|uniref:hypothetical protein n=1 Tax=Streptomyces sp. CC210A TaxID=2898184 RepID=UPI0035A96130
MCRAYPGPLYGGAVSKSTAAPASPPPPVARASRASRRARIAAGFAVLLTVAGYVAVRYETGGRGAPGCVVGSGTHTYRFTPEQASNAATIAAVGTTKGMPERAVTIALATALQESALRNIDYGDRDSLGLFQQRPSQGWGSERQIMDPVYASAIFYDRLAEVPGYSRLPLTVAAQKVQRSGFPQAYAKHEPDAALLAAALTGRSRASLTCTTLLGSRTGDAAQVRAELTRSFGTGLLVEGAGRQDGPDDGKGAPAGGSAGTSAPAEGADVVTVPVGPVPGSLADEAADREDTAGGGVAPAGSRRGWELAQWAVAQADALRIEEVSYAGRVWSARLPAHGWREVPGGGEPRRETDRVRIRVAARTAR